MPTPFSQALLYAVAPAVLGVVAALAFLLPARREASLGPEDQGRAMLFLALPAGAVVLALLGVFVAQSPDAPDARVPLLALGAAAFVQSVAQGVLGARVLRSLASDPAGFGRGLVTVAAPEVLTIGALLWVFLAAGGG